MFTDTSAPRRPPARDLDSPAPVRKGVLRAPLALLRSLLRIRFLRFLLVAGLNTVFGYGLFAALILIGLRYPLAAAIATVLGILFNFQTTGRLVFGRHDLSLILRFLAVYVIGYVVGIVLLGWAERRGISVLLAAAVLAIPMGFFSYTLQRLLVFRRIR
jgi:putative flippase GtrA